MLNATIIKCEVTKQMNLKKTLYLVVFCSFLLIPAGLFFADTIVKKQIRITECQNVPVIDGKINDPCWEKVTPYSNFYQFDPVNGVKASESTQVWVTYNKTHIFFAFFMQDSQPDKIWAELTPRNRYGNNDSITVILDTYNDQRTSMQFTVNPRGVQKNSTETIWQSNAIIRTDGWTAEIAIPFKSLRFSAQKNQIWGVNFERYIQRLNERDFWTKMNRNKPQLQQMGKLYGMQGIKPSYNLEFFPYFGVRSSHWDKEKDNKVAFGMDVKYGILPNLILDFTASPDFSEVESDPFIYQLSPFENYLRENRPFFAEGRHYFGGKRKHFRGGDSASFNLFYSRRIESPKFAAKLTGKSNGFSYGMLGALNNSNNNSNQFFSVLRLKKDVFANSQIGLYYAGLDQSGAYNRNFGFDYNFKIKDIYSIQGQSAFSLNSNIKNTGNQMHVLRLQRNPDAGWVGELFYRSVAKNVKVLTGYINQTNIQQSIGRLGYAWRYNSGLFKFLKTMVTAEMNHDMTGNLTKQKLKMGGRTQLISNLNFFANIETGKSKYQIYNQEKNLNWSKQFIDVYGGATGFRWHKGGFLKSMSLWYRWHHKGIYNKQWTDISKGRESNLDMSLTLRPRSNLEFYCRGEWARQWIDKTGELGFNGFLYQTRLHYQVNRRLFISTQFMGETYKEQYNLDVLAGYYFGAGNIIQLCYKNSSRLVAGIREKGYSITLKLSYLFRL
jgi:hypothetical protein